MFLVFQRSKVCLSRIVSPTLLETITFSTNGTSAVSVAAVVLIGQDRNEANENEKQ